MTDNKSIEVNFDRIIGPTHNFSGLSYGNTASTNNQNKSSNPRAAALQGLNKMKFLSDLGIKQAILPPQQRPHIETLRRLGFTGTDSAIIEKAHIEAPEILIASSSSAAMWTANAATISPSADSFDHRLHITTANLTSKFHRSIEAEETYHNLKEIFANPQFFKHHSPLPPGTSFSDEGAANHTRFCQTYGGPGVQLFNFGRYSFQSKQITPSHFPARQTYEASQAVARLHQLSSNQTVFAQQHPEAIDAGAFHNDVVSVGNCNVFLFHEKAFLDKERVLDEIRQKVMNISGCEMVFFEAKATDISLTDAINTYLFNSQIISLPNRSMALIAPIECRNHPSINQFIDQVLLTKNSPISEVHFLDVRESMRNGGGPACLRLRVVLTPQELAAVHPKTFLDDTLYHALVKWINTYYRDKLIPQDLGDPNLFTETNEALMQLNNLLQLKGHHDIS